MGWKVKWARPAWNDVEAAAAVIARDSPRYALVLQREAQAAARSLAEMPWRGGIVAQRDDEHIRQLLIGSYRLIYRIASEAEVHVIAFIHGARDSGDLLSER